MPASLTYPGVYIEEISSGVHTITGVATSIAAFIGWADQGPIYEATLVQSWSDFAAQYGGLDARSNLGYAVNQFFGNGGQQAYIIRVAWDGSLTASPGTTMVPCAAAVAGALPLGAVISATLGGFSGFTTLGVTANATLLSIAITPNPVALLVGGTQVLKAVGTFADTTTKDLTGFVTWSAAAGGAAVMKGASVSALNAGATSVTATLGGVIGTAPVNIAAAPALSSVEISAPAALAVGASETLIATGTYADATTADVTAAAVWTSSSALVAMTGPTATAVGAGPGSATITATVGGVTPATAALTVNALTVAGIKLSTATVSGPVGTTQAVTVTATYSDTSTGPLAAGVTWTSSNSKVATVAGGQVTIVGAGTAKITAAWGSVPSQTVAVTATTTKTLVSIAVTPANPTVPALGAQQFAATGTYSDGSTADLTSAVAWASASPAAASITSGGDATALAVTGSLAFSANSPGAWGNNLSVSVTPQAANPTRFSVLVQQAPAQPGGPFTVLENFVNLSANPTDPTYVVTVINSDSQYLTITDPGAAGFVGTPIATPPVAAGATPPTFANGADGSVLTPASDGNFEVVLSAGGPPGGSAPVQGLYLLERVDIFNLLCIPGETDAPTIQDLQAYCAGKRAFYIVDCPQLSTTSGLIGTGPVGSTAGPLTGANSANSAYYFPWVQAPDALAGGRSRLFPPCGFVAGIYATTDANRGVWKAPAGIDAGLSGLSGLQYKLTDLENGSLNTQAVNCLREFKVYGDVVWGARTLQGNDQAGSEWKYIPIRRLALFLESSLYDGTQWVVFEPNDTPLWSQIRLNVGTFMQGLFLQGAFQGTTPQQAYFVKCDAENNPQSSIDQGIVNILVGFAPLYPAEFVVIQIQQLAGQTQS